MHRINYSKMLKKLLQDKALHEQRMAMHHLKRISLFTLLSSLVLSSYSFCLCLLSLSVCLRVVVCGLCGVCAVWCDTEKLRVSSQHVPVCAFETSQCILATRANVSSRVCVVPPTLREMLDLFFAQSLNAPLCPLQCTHHTKLEHSSNFRVISFLFFLLRGTTTQGQTPPRQRHVQHHTTPQPPDA